MWIENYPISNLDIGYKL